MREVFVDKDFTRIGLYKSILDQAGIASLIRNENSHHSMAEIPLPLFYPALCVLEDGDYDRAMEILGKIHDAPEVTAPDWKCAECGEAVPANFDTCWHCGSARTQGSTGNR